MRTIVVTGSRSLNEQQSIAVQRRLDETVDPLYDVVLCGCAPGVDALARAMVSDAQVYRADWERLGRRAGPKRNERMIRAAAGMENVTVLAFPAQRSRGTWDCIRRAVRAQLSVCIFPLPEPQ